MGWPASMLQLENAKIEEENQSYEVNVGVPNGVGRNGPFRITF